MDANLRARSDTLKRAQAAAQQGRTGEALGHLEDHVIEASESGALLAAERWLALPPQEREPTAIYASGRRLRAEINTAVQTGLAANGEIGPDRRELTILSRVNATREELRHVRTYEPGMVLEVGSRQARQGLGRGRYTVSGVDAGKGSITLADERGRIHRLLPARIGRHGDSLALQLFERKALRLYTGDTIRWTANDHERGLINADRATVTAIEKDGIAVRSANGMEYRLANDDPMLAKIDLAYALNAHMAQGLTSDKGIAVMDSRERRLLSGRTFLVTVTRLRDELTLILDNRDKVAVGLERNPGEKASALEITERLGVAAAKGQQAGLPREEVQPKPELERTIERVKPFEIGI